VHLAGRGQRALAPRKHLLPRPAAAGPLCAPSVPERVKASRPLWVCELRKLCRARWGHLGQEEDCPAARELLHSRQRHLKSLHLSHQDGGMDRECYLLLKRSV
jgi:hypothetical protein